MSVPPLGGAGSKWIEQNRLSGPQAKPWRGVFETPT